jgi:hypothetical protein
MTSYNKTGNINFSLGVELMLFIGVSVRRSEGVEHYVILMSYI